MSVSVFSKSILVAAVIALAPALAVAQQSPATPSTTTPRLDQRQANQQQRINKGTASGQLTTGETRRLDRGEARLQRHEAHDKAHGMNRHERRQLRREANRMNRRVAVAKHNAHHQPK
jgi:hypothetical protein